jgi:hypothetical protein
MRKVRQGFSINVRVYDTSYTSYLYYQSAPFKIQNPQSNPISFVPPSMHPVEFDDDDVTVGGRSPRIVYLSVLVASRSPRAGRVQSAMKLMMPLLWPLRNPMDKFLPAYLTGVTDVIIFRLRCKMVGLFIYHHVSRTMPTLHFNVK